MQKLITVIKYGTAVLTIQNFEGQNLIDANTLAQHGHIINAYKSPVVVVSSGAVGIGKSLIKNRAICADPTTAKRLLAEIGQPYLVEAWKSNMPDKIVLQKLVTYADLERETSTNTIKAALENSFLYIFNFNDGVDDAELKEDKDHTFGDNDQLATVVAKTCTPLAQQCRLIFNTSSDGFINKDTQQVIPHLSLSELSEDFIAHHCDGVSRGGTGGMGTKLFNIKEALQSGTQEAWIINGKKPEQLHTILNGGHAGTKVNL